MKIGVYPQAIIFGTKINKQFLRVINQQQK